MRRVDKKKLQRKKIRIIKRIIKQEDKKQKNIDKKNNLIIEAAISVL